MKHYNYTLVLVMMLLCSTSLWAQRPSRERIKALKIAYITEQLALSSKEAEAFWPIYNAHDNTLQHLRKKERQGFGSYGDDLQKLTQEQAAQLLLRFKERQAQRQQIEEKFMADLEQVISAKQIILLIHTEENFKRRLLQEVRKRREKP